MITDRSKYQYFLRKFIFPFSVTESLLLKMANWNTLLPSQFKPTSFIAALRAFLGGRNFKPNVRMVDEVSSATQPPPDIPGGPHHTVFNNYYYARDGRREVAPPIVVIENTTKQIENKKSLESSSPSKLPLPGKIYHWD